MEELDGQHARNPALGVHHRPVLGLVRQQVGLPIDQRDMPAEQKLSGEAIAVLQAWVSKQKK